MAASSKSSTTVKSVVIALLALWSVISLVVIVVWATSPDLKSSAQCRAELQEVTEKLEGAKVVHNKNKVALEEMVEAAREEQARQSARVLLLTGHLNATNATLEQCRQHNLVLNGNISVLQETVEQLRQTEANLTAHVALQEDHIEVLQQNVSVAGLQTLSCFSLKAAAESHMLASQSETRACESQRHFLHKQLQKCKDSSAAEEKQQQQDDASSSSSSSSKPPGSSAPPLTGVPPLTLLLCGALMHLLS